MAETTTDTFRALEEAIEAHIKATAAQDYPNDSLMLREWVLLAATDGIDTDGDEVSLVSIVPSGAPHRLSGLLENARSRLASWTRQQYGHGE